MARLTKHARWIPGAVFLVLATLCIQMSVELSRHLEAEQHIELDVATQHLSRRLENCIQDRISLLAVDAENWEQQAVRDAAAFDRFSEGTLRRFAGFQALNWIDPDGVIRWVAPLAGNEPVVGLDITRHPGARTTFAIARETRQTAVTPPMALAQGGTGFATYVPLQRDGHLEGYINGVFRAQTVVETCLKGAPDRRVAFDLLWENRPVAHFGPPEPPTGPVLGWNLPVGEHRWRGRAWLAPPPLSRAFWVHLVPLILGGLLTLATSGGVWWALRRQASAQAANARARVLLENAPQAMIVYVPALRRVVDLNAPARQMLAPEPETVAAIVAGPGGLAPERFARALAGEPQVLEHVFPLPEGEAPCEVRLVGLPGEQEGQICISLVDIRERRRAAQERERLLAALTVQATQLEDVVYSAAHELRTPLVGIGGHAGVVRDELGDATPAPVQIALDAIERQVTVLDRRLDGLRRLADLGRRPLETTRVDADRVVAAALAELTPPANASAEGERPAPRGATRVEGPLPPCLADAHLLQVVFHELLVAAFTPGHGAPPDPHGDGAATVGIRGHRTGDEVCYELVDAGHPLSDAERARVRGLFHGAPDRGGEVGIGQAVAERAASRMGGRLVVGEAEGGGTRVRLYLPAAATT